VHEVANDAASAAPPSVTPDGGSATSLARVASPTAPTPPDGRPTFHLSARSARFAFGAAYELILPLDLASSTSPAAQTWSTWVRQAIQVSAEVRLGPASSGAAALVVGADVALASRRDGTARGFALGLSDRAVGASLLLVREWSTLALAAGPRASVHLLGVDARDDDGRLSAAHPLALGLGGVVRVELALGAHARIYLGGSLEALFPKREFTIGGQPALGTGDMLAGFSAGLRVLIL
jgi:hypothetical protein